MEVDGAAEPEEMEQDAESETGEPPEEEEDDDDEEEEEERKEDNQQQQYEPIPRLTISIRGRGRGRGRGRIGRTHYVLKILGKYKKYLPVIICISSFSNN